MFRALLAFLVCVLGAYGVGTVLASEVMLRQIDASGLPVTLHDRLRVAHHDLFGLAPLYLPRTAIALAPAILLATALALLPGIAGERYRWLRALIHVACGATALVLLHLLMREYDPARALGAAYKAGGLLQLGLAGGFGAYIFFVATGQAHR